MGEKGFMIPISSCWRLALAFPWFCVLFVFLLLIGCGPGTEEAEEIRITTSSSDCTNDSLVFSSEFDSEDCLEITVKDDLSVQIFHSGAAFNCCPGTISANISVEGDRITIIERESESACDCLCLYDVTHVLTGLAAGTYYLDVHEPYVMPDDEELHCEFSVQEAYVNTCCLSRKYYPWSY